MAVASYAWEFEQLARLSRQQPDLVNRAMQRFSPSFAAQTCSNGHLTKLRLPLRSSTSTARAC
jgi:hypothetical protein